MNQEGKDDDTNDLATMLDLAERTLAEWVAQTRSVIAQGRALMPPHLIHRPDYDGHERRLDEIERLVRRKTPEDMGEALELREEFELEFQVDMAAVEAEMSERLVSFTDKLARRVEEKKFELSEETRAGLDLILLPYQDGMREQMLDVLPIETRRRLEEEKRRLDEGE
jgi:hypothetical protein